MAKKPHADFLSALDKVPPCIVRWKAIARSGKTVRLLNNRELAKRSGLSKRMIQRISSKSSWAGIRAEVIDQFLYGCNASLHDLGWYEDFLTEFADTNFPHVVDPRMRAVGFKAMGWMK